MVIPACAADRQLLIMIVQVLPRTLACAAVPHKTVHMLVFCLCRRRIADRPPRGVREMISLQPRVSRRTYDDDARHHHHGNSHNKTTTTNTCRNLCNYNSSSTNSCNKSPCMNVWRNLSSHSRLACLHSLGITIPACRQSTTNLTPRIASPIRCAQSSKRHPLLPYRPNRRSMTPNGNTWRHYGIPNKLHNNATTIRLHTSNPNWLRHLLQVQRVPL